MCRDGDRTVLAERVGRPRQWRSRVAAALTLAVAAVLLGTGVRSLYDSGPPDLVRWVMRLPFAALLLVATGAHWPRLATATSRAWYWLGLSATIAVLIGLWRIGWVRCWGVGVEDANNAVGVS